MAQCFVHAFFFVHGIEFNANFFSLFLFFSLLFLFFFFFARPPSTKLTLIQRVWNSKEKVEQSKMISSSQRTGRPSLFFLSFEFNCEKENGRSSGKALCDSITFIGSINIGRVKKYRFIVSFGKFIKNY